MTGEAVGALVCTVVGKLDVVGVGLVESGCKIVALCKVGVPEGVYRTDTMIGRCV